MESETDSKPESIEARVEGMVTGVESDNPVKGADVAVLRTDEDYLEPLIAFFRERTRRG